MKGFIKWALIIFVINAVLAIVGYLTMDENSMRSGGGGLGQILYWAGMIIALGLVFMGIREKKMANLSEFTFGKGFTEGLLICLFSGLFIGFFSYIFYSFVAQDAIEAIREGSYQAMIDQGTPQAQIDQAKPMMDFFISPLGFFIWAVVGYTFIGIVVSLVVAAIVNAMGPKSGGNEPIAA